MAGLTITIDTGECGNPEYAAINAMIAVLRGKQVVVLPDQPHDPVMPEITTPNAGPASSSGNGAGFQAGTSTMVPAVPVVANVPPILPVPPVPAAVVPPPPVSNGAVPASPPAGVELDADGLPWDARIHGVTKEKTAKGVWKRRRNTDDAEWDRVRAELKQVMSAGAPPTPIEALAARVPDAASAFAVPNVPPPPPPVPVATVPPVPAATSAPDIGAFGALLKRIIEAQDAKQITVEQTNQAVQSMGLNTIGDLLNRPDLVAPVELVLFG